MIKIKVIYFDTLIPSYHTYSHIGIYSCIGLVHVYLHEYFVFSFLIYYFVLSTLHAIVMIAYNNIILYRLPVENNCHDVLNNKYR